VKSSANFAQLVVLLLPAGFERPGEDLLKMIAVIHSGVEKNPGLASQSAGPFSVPVSSSCKAG
jgi:hypothetical protein